MEQSVDFRSALLVQKPPMAGIPTDLNSLMTCKIILMKPKQNKNLVEEKALLETVYKEMWVSKHMYVRIYACTHIFIQAQVCNSILSTYRQAKQHTFN